jgi:hypothetical protein
VDAAAGAVVENLGQVVAAATVTQWRPPILTRLDQKSGNHDNVRH